MIYQLQSVSYRNKPQGSASACVSKIPRVERAMNDNNISVLVSSILLPPSWFSFRLALVSERSRLFIIIYKTDLTKIDPPEEWKRGENLLIGAWKNCIVWKGLTRYLCQVHTQSLCRLCTVRWLCAKNTTPPLARVSVSDGHLGGISWTETKLDSL